MAKNDDFVFFAKELSELNNQNDSNLDKLNKSNMSNGQTVEDNLVSLISKMGEKITQLVKQKHLTNQVLKILIIYTL